MRPYAELPWRLSRQIAADVAMVGWVALWIWAAVAVHEAIQSLSAFTDKVSSSGNSLEQSLNDAADEANKIPLVGEGLGDRIADAADAARSVAEAGTAGTEKINQLALLVALIVALAPILPMLTMWLRSRLRWTLRARILRQLRDTPEGMGGIDGADGLQGVDLLALRALTTAPLRDVRRVHADPAGAWRAKDPDAIMALAGLELRSLGLRSRPARFK
ncbi:MAG: hypothetical protein H0T78_06200 [Longispora sp.]|nr:hypothetical protein [Longispora sp. (in: high G+C Gram-positive bacteria)]